MWLLSAVYEFKTIELKIIIFVISFTSNKDTFKKTEQFHKTNLFPILD